MQELRAALQKVARDLYKVDIEPELSRPAEQFGDYSTNLALQLAGRLNKPPREIAEALAAKLTSPDVASAEVAGPGFINLTLSDAALLKNLDAKPVQSLAGQEILVEFGDPNPFKEMHIGHLYSYIVGDAISSLLDASGAQVRHLSYHGDVGLHVAKAIFGMRELKSPAKEPGVAFLGEAYAYGSQKYDEDAIAKAQIEQINQAVYSGDDPEVTQLHQMGVELTFKDFDRTLNLLGINTDKRYLESQTSGPGIELVKKNIGKVFKESQGAIIFEGEKVGLHTRVFITSKGVPTYETKDLGLVKLKDQDYPKAAHSIVITANEQNEYFKVMMAALTEINPQLAAKMTHLGHGFVNLTSGKMSSRTGNVYPAMELLLAVKAAVHEQYPDSAVRKQVTFAAVKYAFLKHRLGSDIVLDIKESIGLEGNSGPYLQYAYARARSILDKSDPQGHSRVGGNPVDWIPDQAGDDGRLEPAERSLARKISEFPEVVELATAELLPSHVATYLYELAQAFNRFYEANRVIDDPRQATRLKLVEAYADVLKNGLGLLNITAPDKL